MTVSDWVASTYPSSVKPHSKPGGKPETSPAAHSVVGDSTDVPSEDVAVTEPTLPSVGAGSVIRWYR